MNWIAAVGFTITITSTGMAQEVTPTPIPGDINSDGTVDYTDLFILHANWSMDRNALFNLYSNWHVGTKYTPTPTPSLTPTGTPTLSPTSTITFTPSPSLSPAPTPTATIPITLTVTVPGIAADARMLEMTLIPAGTFLMGSPNTEKGRYNDEGPQHNVTISKAFYIGNYEITNAQFRAFKLDHSSGDYDDLTLDTNDQPAVYISWNDAIAFCKWLTEKTGLTFRLPTEAEWEYACRAGSSARYYWGDDLNNNETCAYANVADISAKLRWETWTVFNCDDGHAVTAPVGRYQPNAFGLYDMLGNTAEWCSDWYGEGYYSQSPATDPQGPASGSTRVLRGGSWTDVPRLVRSAFRNESTPDYSWDTYGFRVVTPLVP